MNNKSRIVKVLGYDKFKCTADKCKFTCCEGWDIAVDKDTYKKWENIDDEKNELLSRVMTKRNDGKKEYYINKKIYEKCPLLDERGLCNVVKSYGEDYLSVTCSSFPRIENSFDNIKELSLSCGCPEVVEIISGLSDNIYFISEDGNNEVCDLLEVKIRETLINILQNKNISLEERLLIGFEMLVGFLKTEEELDEDFIVKVLEKYEDKSVLEELTKGYKEDNINKDKGIYEVNSLFLDIIRFYKRVASFRELLTEVSISAENINQKAFLEQWIQYKEEFKEVDSLIEKCIVLKVLNSCCSEDVEEMVVAFQMIIIEYILVRYAVFLKYFVKKDKNINVEEVKEYIVAFSRIIGNNSDAVLDFLEEGFGDYILENEYLNLITLF